MGQVRSPQHGGRTWTHQAVTLHLDTAFYHSSIFTVFPLFIPCGPTSHANSVTCFVLQFIFLWQEKSHWVQCLFKHMSQPEEMRQRKIWDQLSTGWLANTSCVIWVCKWPEDKMKDHVSKINPPHFFRLKKGMCLRKSFSGLHVFKWEPCKACRMVFLVSVQPGLGREPRANWNGMLCSASGRCCSRAQGSAPSLQPISCRAGANWFSTGQTGATPACLEPVLC